MISDDEKRFMEYWKQNRTRLSRWYIQLLSGLPWGLLVFGLPLLVNVLAGKTWYTRLPFIGGGEMLTILFASSGMVVFYALFRKRFIWERNEERFQELQHRMNKESQDL